jgi:hypothetical protein
MQLETQAEQANGAAESDNNAYRLAEEDSTRWKKLLEEAIAKDEVAKKAHAERQNELYEKAKPYVEKRMKIYEQAVSHEDSQE